MLCSQLSTIKSLVDDKQYCEIKKYFESLAPSSKMTAYNFATTNGVDFQLSQKILQELVKVKFLKHDFCIRCPECGLLLSSVESITSIEKEQYCYNCDETVEVSSDDIEVVYTFSNYPFVKGQQSDFPLVLEESVALQCDSLARLLESGLLDINAAFFAPTDKEYQDLQNTYNSIFSLQTNTKATGDTLEHLTIKLFNLCKHFRATSSIRLQVNQIDCYVRNTLYIPGISQAGCIDSFEIECKNEKSSPKAGYMNKLHGILRLSGKNLV